MIGLIFLGLMLPRAVSDFRSFDRIVTVKGLCEKEVPADKVIWPLIFKVVGNDINTVYSEINRNTRPSSSSSWKRAASTSLKSL